MRARVPIYALGVVMGLYGVYLLLSREGSNAGLVSAGTWLVVGVVLHDFVLAPLTLGVLFLGRHLVPKHALRAATVALVVLGTATIFAIPVLTGYGRRADNPTLDNRHYWIGWLVLVVILLVAVLVTTLVRRYSKRASPHATHS